MLHVLICAIHMSKERRSALTMSHTSADWWLRSEAQPIVLGAAREGAPVLDS